jgi:hypothetical protein
MLRFKFTFNTHVSLSRTLNAKMLFVSVMKSEGGQTNDTANGSNVHFLMLLLVVAISNFQSMKMIKSNFNFKGSGKKRLHRNFMLHNAHYQHTN